VTPSTKTQLEQLMSWENKMGIDFWSHGGAQRSSRVMASSEAESSFLNFLTANGISYEMIIENVEQSLQRDKIAQIKGRSKRNTFESGQPNFSLFWSYDEIASYLEQLPTKYPNLVTKEVIGKSFEMRDIVGIRVSKNSEFGVNPIVFIDSGTHAREWAGIQSSLYFLHQLVENATVRDELLEKVDYVFVNVVNVDGYIYTWEEDRLWRKNRRYVNYTCTGIDLNRNYPYNWRYSPNSCPTNGYSGAEPLSGNFYFLK
jgi:murein tripeptide amidase MpaA